MAVFSLIPTNVTMYNHDCDLPFIRGVTMVSGIEMQPWAVQTRLCTGKPPQRFLKYRFLRPHEIRISRVGIQIYSSHVGVSEGQCFKSFLIQLLIPEVSTEYLAQITPPCEFPPVKSFTVPLWARVFFLLCFFSFLFSIYILWWISSYSLRWNETLNPLASASQIPGLEVCATTVRS